MTATAFRDVLSLFFPTLVAFRGVFKDRLLRFGAKLVFAICEIKNIEIVILNQGEDTSLEQDLAQDVLEIIAVFSARLYGARSKKNKNLIDGLKAVAAAR